MYYDKFMLRYSSRLIFGVMKPNPAVYLVNVNNETEVDQFNQVLGNLMSNLKDEASLGYSYRKYATDNATATNFQTLYGMVQCTPDLSQQDCFDCLDRAISQIPNCCNGKIGGRVLTPSCSIRYENYSFYEPTPMLCPPSTLNTSSTNSTSSQGTLHIFVN